MAPFKPLFPPSTKRPPFPDGSPLVFIRDQFSTPTWLLLGAALLGTATLLIRDPILVYLVYLALAAKVLDTFLQTKGFRPNRSLEGVVLSKYAAQLPPVLGEEDVPASQGVVVFMLGARINHPLGIMAPGASELTKWAKACYEECSSKYDEYGLLGMQNFLGTDSPRSNEILTLMYFRDTEGLHKFALSPAHRDTWEWWLRIQKTHPHLGIMHETYDVPARSWEAIYLQMPKTGLGAASVRMSGEEKEAFGLPERNQGEKEGEEVWWSTPVDATRGKLRSSRGRMARSDGSENEKEGFGEY